MTETQKTLNGDNIFPEAVKILHDYHVMKLNGDFKKLKTSELNKFFHNKDKKLENYK